MTNLDTLGRLLLLFGALIFIAGLGLIAAARLNLPVGRLPGDVLIQRPNVTVYFPFVSCLVLSIVLTIILNVVFLLFRRQ